MGSGSLLETASALGTGADPARTTNKYGGNGGYGAWATSTTKEKDDEEEAKKEKDEEETKENEGCICPEVYQPVCGSNDKTYSNGCAANCEEVTVQYEGACTTTTNKYGGNGGYGAWATSTTKENEGCICPEVYQPVCGSNDKTYSNNCTANC